MLNMDCYLMRALHKGDNVLAGLVRTFCSLFLLFVLAQLHSNLVCPCPFALESCLSMPSCVGILFVHAQLHWNLVCPCPVAFESSASKKPILCMVDVLPQMYALLAACLPPATCLPSAWHSFCAYASLAGSSACETAQKQLLPTEISSQCSLYIQPETGIGDRTQA